MIPPGLLRFERSSEKRVDCGGRELTTYLSTITFQ